MISFSVFSNAHDNAPGHLDTTWEEFVFSLQDPELVECPSLEQSTKIKEQGACWSPAKFNGTRSISNTRELSCLVFDFDGPKHEGLTREDKQEILNYIKSTDVVYAAHSSFTNGFCYPLEKFRVVLLFATPVSPSEYKRVWSVWASSFPGAKPDPACKDVSRIYFTPRIPTQHKDLYWCESGGSILLTPENYFDRRPTKWGLNDVKVGQVLTEQEHIASLSTCAEKNTTLNRVVYICVLERLRKRQTLDKLWELCEAALRSNTVSAPVKDWVAARRQFDRTVEAATRKFKEESSTEADVDADELAAPSTEDEIKHFKPSEKQLKKANSSLKEFVKIVKADTSQLGTAAYNLGKFTPHVLAPAAVAKSLRDACLSPTAQPLVTATAAELTISAGIARGAKYPKYVSVGWMKNLLTDENGNFLSCDENVQTVLTSHPECVGLLRHDVRLGKPVITRFPPWGTEQNTSSYEFEEHEAGGVALWVAQVLGGKPVGHRRALECLLAAASLDSFDPFQEWLESLEWDGTHRLEGWLVKYAGAENSEYVRAVSKRFLISAVARTYRPNCQADCMLVLQSAKQGMLKSKLLGSLLPEERYFLDRLGDISNKDTLLALEQHVIVEIAELSGFSKKESNEIKSFITGRSALVRASYARLARPILRRSVFAGTTNDERFLRDETGGRRFWPVQAPKCDPAGLALVREQVWAEAVSLYKAGVQWHMTDTEVLLAEEKQEAARVLDDLESTLVHVLEHPLKQHTYEAIECASDDTLMKVYQGQLDENKRLRWVTAGQACHIVGLDIREVRNQHRVAAMLRAHNYLPAGRQSCGEHRPRIFKKES